MPESKNSKKFSEDFHSMVTLVIFNSLGFFFLDFLLPYFTSQQLNATGLQIGLVSSFLVMGYFISSTFTGFITDRVNAKKKLLLVGSIGRGLSYFMIYSAMVFKSLFLLNISTFTLGFFAGFFWIPFNTLIAEKSHKNNRSEAFGRKDFSVGVGTFIGSMVGFTIFIMGTIFYPENAYLIYCALIFFGISNIIAGFHYISRVDESKKISSVMIDEQENNHYDEKEEKNPTIFLIGFLFLIIALLLSYINNSLAKPFLNVYLLETITNVPQIAVLAFIPSGIVSMLLAPKLGKMVDKIHPALGISCASVLGALTTWFLINSSSIWLFSLLLVIDVTISSTTNLIIQNFLSRITIKNRGKIIGIHSTFMNLGNITGPILGGMAWDNIGMKAPFMISIVVELFLIPFYILAVIIVKPYIQEGYESQKIMVTESIS